MSMSRLNFDSEAEDAINRQILTELTASYIYLSMASWFARDNIALHGLAEYYRKMSHEEYEHGQKFIEYMTKRGGIVKLQSIPAPETEWKSALNILETTLKMEKDVTQSLLNISKIASLYNDPELEDFISSEFLHDQVEDIKKTADLITQLNLAGTTGLGLYLFDKQIAEKNKL